MMLAPNFDGVQPYFILCLLMVCGCAAPLILLSSGNPRFMNQMNNPRRPASPVTFHGLAIAIALATMAFALSSCSRQGNPALYGKWRLKNSAFFKGDGTRIDNPGGTKTIEYRKDGGYLEGNRPGKFQFVDNDHVALQIDGLAGTAKIVLQGDNLEVWNPDGTTVEYYERIK